MEEALGQQRPQGNSTEREARPIPPLIISGVVVSKQQLIEALRVYIPNIADFSALEDGEHFYILFSPGGQALAAKPRLARASARFKRREKP